jgi:peptidyl-prolyl cis-trans isomerase D
MSIIQSIRDKGAWVIGTVIALALIAFILQDGLNKRGSVLGSSSTVGKVNGVSINKDEFNQRVENATKNNPQQREGIVSQLWNYEVDRILMDQEFEKVGIECTDKQLSEDLFKPSSPLMNEFKDPQTGIADVEKAKDAFKQFKKNAKEEDKKSIFEGIIQPTMAQAKRTKYLNLISQAAYAPKWLIEKQQADNSTFATVSYVAIPYSSIADSTVKVSDDEIVAYGKKHSKFYSKDDETRSIQFVSFDAIPSAADSAAAKAKVENKKADFIAEQNIETFFAKNVSEMPYYNGYITGASIKQQMKDSLIKLSVNATYGPYVDGANYVVAKMVGIKSMPDSAKVRHILIKTMNRDPRSGQEYRMRDDSTAKHLLDTVRMKLAAGGNFDSLCLKYSEDDGSKNKGGVYDYFASGNMVAAFNNFAFTNAVGSKDVVKTEFGYHYVEVLGQKGNSTAYNIAYYSKPIVLSNETDVTTKAEATKFIASVKNKKEFDDAVAALKKMSSPADNIKKEDYNVGGLGSNRALVRWIYENGVGNITDQTFNFNNKYVVAIVTAVNKPGVPSALALRQQVEPLVKNEKKAQQIVAKLKGATLEAMATAYGNNTIVNKIDTLLASNTFNPVLGNDYKFAGAVFNASNKGKVTEAIAGQSGVFALKTENIAARAGVPVDVMSLKTMLTNSIKSAGGKITNELLKKAANITDSRSEIY